MALKPRYDAVVVGAGAGGAAAAWRLCERGLQVLLLEAGPRFDPARDYPLTQSDWERHNFPERPGSQAMLSFGEFDRLDAADSDLRSWNKVSGPINRSAYREPSGPGYWHVQGLGGSTLHFVGESHRLHPAAFQSPHTGSHWPISYAELEPYYDTCEKLIGVAGPASQGERWRSAPFPLPAHPLSPAAACLQAAGRRIGMDWQANSRAALSLPYDGRAACNYCGNCSRGCPRGDKGSADVTFIRKAEKTGRLTVKTGCQVIRLHPAADGRIASLDYLENKQLQRQDTPVLILAAGAVQTPRLLLTNKSAQYPQGIANSSGQVGRNFMETLFWSSTGLLPALSNSHKGLPSDAICWDFNAPHSIPGISGGCRFNSNVQEIGLVGPVAYASRIVQGFGKALKDDLRKNFGRAVSVGAVGSFLPNAESYVDLDPVRKDAAGLPLPRIHSQLGPENIQLLRFMASQSRKLLQAAGVSELLEEWSAGDTFSATHVFGTCRMGKSSADSVVNALGRSHDHSNLYLADASVFPSSGGGESPSLSIQALAVRMADGILDPVKA